MEKQEGKAFFEKKNNTQTLEGEINTGCRRSGGGAAPGSILERMLVLRKGRSLGDHSCGRGTEAAWAMMTVPPECLGSFH